jgi:hypothetical protein
LILGVNDLKEAGYDFISWFGRFSVPLSHHGGITVDNIQLEIGWE